MSDYIRRNEYGEVVYLSNLDGDEDLEMTLDLNAKQIADHYIRTHAAILGMHSAHFESERFTWSDTWMSDEPVVKLNRSMQLNGASVVVYEQSVRGLAVYNAMMFVLIDNASQSVISVQSSLHGKIQISNPAALRNSSTALQKSLSNEALALKLGFDAAGLRDGLVRRQIVYRFEPAERLDTITDMTDEELNLSLPVALPGCPDSICKGEHYIVDEVLFEMPLSANAVPTNWVALIEPESETILSLRVLSSAASQDDAEATGGNKRSDPDTRITGTALSNSRH